MIGKLTKLTDGWYVKFFEDGTVIHTYLPLHPDDVKQIEEDAKMFDNIEVRIAAYPHVEFKINDYRFAGKYAKLIPSKKQQKQLITEIMEEDAKDGLYDYPELEGTMAVCNHVINKRKEPVEDDVEKLAKQYVNTNYPEYITQKEKSAAIADVCWGYNKAKETLYTEEQMIEYGKFVAMMTSAATMDAEIAKLEHEQCFKLFLKQPKKD